MSAKHGRHWERALLANREGKPLPILANAITAFRTAPEWQGVLAFNEFTLGIVTLKPAPWDSSRPGAEWTDNDDVLAANWLQHQHVIVSRETAGQAVQVVASEHRFHPVRQYLDGLTWDGVARTDGWLSLYLGAEPTTYTATVGGRWMISAVARVYQPGIKADCCLILEGQQGLRKSTALKIIAGEWFTDEIADFGTKDAAMQIRGVWIVEIAELVGLRRPDVGRIKAFMSRATDRFRPPYGRRLIESARQCVFAGTVNHKNYLKDDTGARRFWPVACQRILTDALARDRDQLWAEAVTRYRNGEAWWLDTPELNVLAEQEQAERYEGDPWDEEIAAWAEVREHVSIREILGDCLGKPKGQWFQPDMNRVARALQVAGYRKFQLRIGQGREWRYRKD